MITSPVPPFLLNRFMNEIISSIAERNYTCLFDSETLNRSVDLILDPFAYV